jgi:hypothetical protein
MGDKNMADFKDVSGGKGFNLAKIKQDGLFFIDKGKIKTRIIKRPIDKSGMKRRAHG